MDKFQETDLALSLLLGGVIGMLVLAIGLVVFFVIYQKMIFRKRLERLDREAANQRTLLRASVAVQEQERERIAGDLHDGIGSLLSAVRLQLSHANEAGNGNTRQEAIDIISEVIQNTRRITHDLLPPVLSKFGLFAAAEDLCERVEKASGLHIAFDAPAQRSLPLISEKALYRVLQELLNNTLKHAGATEISVTFARKTGAVTLVYTDNGKGFAVDQSSPSIAGIGLGLHSIQTRIELIEGNLTWSSQPGRGTQLNVTVPAGIASPSV
ncbi:MAG: sensor histidine kinase [Saprospiraceae bacterium]